MKKSIIILTLHCSFLLSAQTAEIEPNDQFSTANFIQQDSLKTGAINSSSDPFDFFVTRLPVDGTLIIYISATNLSSNPGNLAIYGFDGKKMSGQVLSKYIGNTTSVGVGKSISDTIILFGRAVDSFYMRFHSSGNFRYNLKYHISDTSMADAEPNNTFAEANYIQIEEEKTGHIKYNANGSNDNYDYYRTKLPYDGSLKIYVQGTNKSGTTGSLYFIAYDGRKSSAIVARYVANNISVKPQQTVYDTIKLYGRGIDSFFFRIDGNGAFNYRLKYEMFDSSGHEIEPNNAITQAKLVSINQVTEGNIGYAGLKGALDGIDFYKIPIPGKYGSIRIITQVVNLSGKNNSIFQSANDHLKSVGKIFTRYIGSSNLPTNIIINDTFVVKCAAMDTFYLNMYTNFAFHYFFKVEFTDIKPRASVQYTRMGNTFGFIPQIANATSFKWEFGDNTSSTLQFPVKTFKAGYFDTRLIVTNSICNFRDTSHTIIDVKGIEYYTPNKGGLGGDIAMQFFGGGLDTSTIIQLVKGTEIITVTEKYSNSVHNHLSAILDLHFATAGSYDVLIKIPGQPLLTYTDGFIIEDLRYPYTWSEVQGRAKLKNNVNVRYNLVVGNRGNVMASGVVLALIWPRDVSLKFEDKFIRPPDTGSVTVSLPNDAQTYTLKRSAYRFIYDSLNTITPIDSFAGKPYKGYMRYLLIPHVPANSTIELPFIAHSTVNGKYNFITYTHKPNMWGSCHTGNWRDYNDDLTAELIDGADMIVDKTKIPLLKAFTKTAKIGQKHAGSAASYMGKHFWAWYDGYEVDEDAAMADWMQETEANNAFALQTATDELGSLMFDYGIGKLNGTYQKQVDFINKRLANNPNMSPKLVDAYISKLNGLNHSGNRRLNTLAEMLSTTKDLGTLSDKLLKLQQMVDDCPELKEQLDDLKKELAKELNQQDVRLKPFTVANSFDPNEITGPLGIGTNGYINNGDRQRFQISFENKDSATAAAQIVIVKDTLDKSKFDLNSFEFGDVSVGNMRIRVPKFRKQFLISRYLSNGISVRINAWLDSLEGIITWQFTAIDTLTKDITDYEGFLPPNVLKPEGEGSVSYSILPKLPVADGEVYKSRAFIYFDSNKPIVTNTWQNQLDIIPPSTLTKASVKPNSTEMEVIVSGTDATSGIGYYNLFVKEGSGAWTPFGGSSSDTITLNGKPGTTYSFFCIGIDKVGNMENKAPIAESTISVSSVSNITTTTKLFIQPNPSDKEIRIEGANNYQYIQIINMLGQEISSEQLISTKENFDISMLKTGIYFIRLYGPDKITQSLKLIKK